EKGRMKMLHVKLNLNKEINKAAAVCTEKLYHLILLNGAWKFFGGVLQLRATFPSKQPFEGHHMPVVGKGRGKAKTHKEGGQSPQIYHSCSYNNSLLPVQEGETHTLYTRTDHWFIQLNTHKPSRAGTPKLGPPAVLGLQCPSSLTTGPPFVEMLWIQTCTFCIQVTCKTVLIFCFNHTASRKHSLVPQHTERTEQPPETRSIPFSLLVFREELCGPSKESTVWLVMSLSTLIIHYSTHTLNAKGCRFSPRDLQNSLLEAGPVGILSIWLIGWGHLVFAYCVANRHNFSDRRRNDCWDLCREPDTFVCPRCNKTRLSTATEIAATIPQLDFTPKRALSSLFVVVLLITHCLVFLCSFGPVVANSGSSARKRRLPSCRSGAHPVTGIRTADLLIGNPKELCRLLYQEKLEAVNSPNSQSIMQGASSLREPWEFEFLRKVYFNILIFVGVFRGEIFYGFSVAFASVRGLRSEGTTRRPLELDLNFFSMNLGTLIETGISEPSTCRSEGWWFEPRNGKRLSHAGHMTRKLGPFTFTLMLHQNQSLFSNSPIIMGLGVLGGPSFSLDFFPTYLFYLCIFWGAVQLCQYLSLVCGAQTDADGSWSPMVSDSTLLIQVSCTVLMFYSCLLWAHFRATADGSFIHSVESLIGKVYKLKIHITGNYLILNRIPRA
ncbi:Anoctamin, partial [Podarcis lilfordi]